MFDDQDEEWPQRLRAHARTLVTAVVGVLLLYLIGLVALIRLVFQPMEHNLKTLQRRLKDSEH